MKTVEITRHKQSATGVKPASTMAVFMDIYRREGLAGINKGVNAVAIRQCTNWGSRSVSSLCPPLLFLYLRCLRGSANSAFVPCAGMLGSD